MKVLWLTNHILPEHAALLGKQPSPMGGWMPALAESLIETQQIELGIATNVKGCQWSQDVVNGKTYFSIPFSLKNGDYRDLPNSLIKDYQRAVTVFKPDIIHIHGTEYFHGLITGRKYIECPSVVSIQGIINAYKEYYFGGLSLKELIKSRTLRDWITFNGLIEQKMEWERRAKWERNIFASNAAFIGRTLWDRNQTYRMNQTARYYHCDELLRPPFYRTTWEINKVKRHTIYVSSALYPLKGFHVLLKAVTLLRREFPDITVRTPMGRFFHSARGAEYVWKKLRSGGYANYLTNLIKQEGLEKHIYSLGVIDATGVANELQKAHVFVLPSFIENSPNSLAEAMSVGTPSIVSLVGGVSSMVNDGESALCFPSGDASALALKIRQIFLDDELAVHLSTQARKVSLSRHDKDKISSTMLDIYRKEIIAQSK